MLKAALIVIGLVFLITDVLSTYVLSIVANVISAVASMPFLEFLSSRGILNVVGPCLTLG